MARVHSLRSLALGLSVASLLLLSAACTVKQQGTPGASDGGAAPDATASRPPLSCLAILQCVGECADADKPCPDACVESGTPDAKAEAGALADCIVKESCTDAPCVQAKCQPSLAACLASSAPTSNGTPLEGAPPAGSVPADLVGSWVSSWYGTTTNLDFHADGTGNWGIQTSIDYQGYCYTEASSESGTIVVTADHVTLYATDVTNLKKPCSGLTTKSPGKPITEEWLLTRTSPTTVIIVDLRCADENAADVKAVEANCTNKLTRSAP